MNNTATAAVILGTLIKTHVAREIVAMLSSVDVLAPFKSPLACQFKIRVYGQSVEELKTNRARCFDAARVFGVGLKIRKQTRSSTILAVGFPNDPFNQVKHYFSEMTVSYLETA